MKKAIVIGATSGIGRELSLLLASKNYLVGITGRRHELLEDLKQQHPANFIEHCYDITKGNNSDELNLLTNLLGGLDLIIISSGTGKINKVLDFEVEKPALYTNVLGYTEIIDWAYNYFLTKNTSGHIVGISSVAGIRGNRFAPAYNASKAYQMIYLESIRHKIAFDKIPLTITDIRPGFVDTAMGQAEKRFWVSSPAKAAQDIYKAIVRKKKVAYITKRWVIIAFILKFSPGWLLRRL